MEVSKSEMPICEGREGNILERCLCKAGIFQKKKDWLSSSIAQQAPARLKIRPLADSSPQPYFATVYSG